MAPGDQLGVSVSGGGIVLTPRRTGGRKHEIVEDPLTGLPVLTAGPDAPALTSEQVREILADFP